MMMLYAKRLTIMACTLVILSGCTTSPTRSLYLETTTAAYMNPNSANATSPIKVQFFFLSSPNAFQHATYNQLHISPLTTLGSALIDQRIEFLKPDSHKIINLKAPLNTKFIGIVANFRTITASNWKRIIRIKQHSDSYLLEIETNNIHLKMLTRKLTWLSTLTGR